MTYIEQTDSTNNRLKAMLAAGETLENGFTLYTYFQTAGRGQQGNSWESERGQNLLFSIVLFPQELKATEQFLLSEVIAVAILRVLQPMLGSSVRIKWPNDIYYEDKKLAGILVENGLQQDKVAWSVIGVGLNVGQTQFLSNAPNPISMKQITGREYDKEWLLTQIQEETILLMTLPREQLHEQYMSLLYRRDEWHRYKEVQVTAAPMMISSNTDGAFEAKIIGVEKDGRLRLLTRDNEQRLYHFKQIRYIIIQTTN